VPLEKMIGGERALRDAAPTIPADVADRLTSADKVSDADRTAILEVATRALAPFRPAPQPEAAAKVAP
jgi:F-type H+-transporting ATPase subunit alpha